MSMPRHLSIEMFADEFGVSTRTVRRWLASGVIRGIRVGPKLIRIPRTEAERLMVAPVGA